MTLPTFTLYINTMFAGSAVGKAAVKAYMVAGNISHLFAVRDDGQQFNVTLRNGRCTLHYVASAA